MLQSDKRHYEVVFLVHPDQSEQLPGMLERYTAMIEQSGGAIHRREDWGRRPLAYSIQKIRKAHYILLNIECSPEIKSELANAFRFNDAIIRSLILKRESAVTEPSAMMKSKSNESHGEGRSSHKRGSSESYDADIDLDTFDAEDE